MLVLHPDLQVLVLLGKLSEQVLHDAHLQYFNSLFRVAPALDYISIILSSYPNYLDCWSFMRLGSSDTNVLGFVIERIVRTGAIKGLCQSCRNDVLNSSIFNLWRSRKRCAGRVMSSGKACSITTLPYQESAITWRYAISWQDTMVAQHVPLVVTTLAS